MKKSSRLLPRLAFALMTLVTLGCGIGSQIFATPTPTAPPTFTPLPTATPTRTPTLTPTPLPDISMARISLEELPAGFEEIPPEEINSSATASSEDGFQPGVTFAFVNTSKFQVIYGMNFFLAEKSDRIGFDIVLNQPEMVLEKFVTTLGTENVHDEKVLDGLEDVGDLRLGMTMVADMKGLPVRVETVMFRRDLIGGMIMSMTFTGQPGSISLHELAKLFDQNIQESLKTFE